MVLGSQGSVVGAGSLGLDVDSAGGLLVGVLLVGVLLVGVTVVAGMTGSADGAAAGVVSSIAGVGSVVADGPGPQVPVVPSTVAVTTTWSNPAATATPAAESVPAIKATTPAWRKVSMRVSVSRNSSMPLIVPAAPKLLNHFLLTRQVD
jgi:hypothetical protein